MTVRKCLLVIPSMAKNTVLCIHGLRDGFYSPLYCWLPGNVENLAHPFEGSDFSAGAIALAIYSGNWAYGGGNVLNLIIDEIKDPIRCGYVCRQFWTLYVLDKDILFIKGEI